MEERRQSSQNLLREMYTRAQGWSALELVAVLDVVASRILAEDPAHGVDLVLQQTLNVLRKRPAVVPDAARPLAGVRAPVVAQFYRPEAGGSDSAGCPPEALSAISELFYQRHSK